MFMIAFMFRPGQYDDDFHRLNDEIQAAAYDSDGYVGQETWVSEDGRTRNAVYYWNDMASLREFGDVAAHRVAKNRYQEWYEGYQIVIAEINETYGDGGVPHVTRR
jgi:heme-degrading monooxygenase HmoA